MVLRIGRGALLGRLHRRLAWGAAAMALMLLGGGLLVWRISGRMACSLVDLGKVVARAAGGDTRVRAVLDSAPEIAALAHQIKVSCWPMRSCASSMPTRRSNR